MAEKKKKATEEKALDKKDNKGKANKKATDKKKTKEEKKSLWVRFRIFCHGVKSEFLKVHWPSKKDMARYSIATIFLIIFCALFFYLINVIFALIQLIFE